ncbi:androgen dependent TFPI regulating protein 1 isoform X3 [Sinocyclocheilus rhinocerous]|uniref:androgen dependent TFPI regulating protein 1 isoform X3 n=1 Tax=Sinocyclocheilus rhinocerous TaxID=307959 RepID=UPI0007B86213|nr:PREDICTED: androgen-dependent TFPI-regulating protein-like isoform X3 [Sinocyclocheilus rhinocerous]
MAAATRLGPKTSLLVHLLILSWYVFAIWSNCTLQTSDRHPGVRSYGGRWKYLTFINLFVFVSFWTLYTYDRELVYPKLLDEIIPIWLNHAMHTVIMPLLLLQMFLQNHRYPSRTKGIFSLALFAALYLSWVLWVHHASGIWVYPIMAHLSPVGLCVFLGGASLSMAPLYLLGEKLSLMMWSSTEERKEVDVYWNPH